MPPGTEVSGDINLMAIPGGKVRGSPLRDRPGPVRRGLGRTHGASGSLPRVGSPTTGCATRSTCPSRTPTRREVRHRHLRARAAPLGGSMKLDWKKTDKAYYLPGTEPELVKIPAFKFFAIRGAGDPNGPEFPEYMAVLYALAYAVRMSPKSGSAPAGYLEYSVFPLEGVWDVSEEAKVRGDGRPSKSDYVFDLMIRQPDFVTREYARSVLERVKAKKPLPAHGGRPVRDRRGGPVRPDDAHRPL
ncbi:MAG: hypothetical protein MZV70_69505 [Desulfobacterales bacterium]|nr:hypothetical protein [Desulfobacterales bacterium]